MRGRRTAAVNVLACSKPQYLLKYERSIQAWSRRSTESSTPTPRTPWNRQSIAIIFKKTVEIVSVQASQDGEEWADVPDWDVQERKYRAELAGKEKNDVERD